jgi:hypothetical protein
MEQVLQSSFSWELSENGQLVCGEEWAVGFNPTSTIASLVLAAVEEEEEEQTKNQGDGGGTNNDENDDDDEVDEASLAALTSFSGGVAGAAGAGAGARLSAKELGSVGRAAAVASRAGVNLQGSELALVPRNSLLALKFSSQNEDPTKGLLLVCDTGNHAIRVVSTQDGRAQTLVGGGQGRGGAGNNRGAGDTDGPLRLLQNQRAKQQQNNRKKGQQQASAGAGAAARGGGGGGEDYAGEAKMVKKGGHGGGGGKGGGSGSQAIWKKGDLVDVKDGKTGRWHQAVVQAVTPTLFERTSKPPRHDPRPLEGDHRGAINPKDRPLTSQELQEHVNDHHVVMLAAGATLPTTGGYDVATAPSVRTLRDLKELVPKSLGVVRVMRVELVHSHMVCYIKKNTHTRKN